jgi:hypothetical protein
MWETQQIGETTVYFYRHASGRYEIHRSQKTELIVRSWGEGLFTRYFNFKDKCARDQNGTYIDDAFVEKTVKSLPELDKLPKEITDVLLSVKLKPKPSEPAL